MKGTLKYIKLIAFIFIIIYFDACKKSDPILASDYWSFFNGNDNHRDKPTLKESYSKNGNYIIHANYNQPDQNHSGTVNDDLIFSFTPQYRILQAGTYELQSNSSGLTVGKACMEVSYNSYYDLPRTYKGSGVSISGQLEVTILSHGQVHILFNNIPTTYKWAQSDEFNTSGIDTVKISGDITY